MSVAKFVACAVALQGYVLLCTFVAVQRLVINSERSQDSPALALHAMIRHDEVVTSPKENLTSKWKFG